MKTPFKKVNVNEVNSTPAFDGSEGIYLIGTASPISGFSSAVDTIVYVYTSPSTTY